MSNDPPVLECQVSPAQVRRARLHLILLASVFVAPMAAAWYFVNFGGAPARQMNYGELVGPRPLPDALANRLFAWQDPVRHSPRRWLLVAVEASPCADACRARLEGLRQIRVATARDEDRVQRVLVTVPAGGAAPADPPPAAPDLRVVPLDVDAVAAFPGQGRLPDGHVYLVDPLGNVVLRFPPDLDRRRVLRDLTRLLQASQIG